MAKKKNNNLKQSDYAWRGGEKSELNPIHASEEQLLRIHRAPYVRI